MISAQPSSPLSFPRVRRFFWLYPDWWCGALAALSWLLILSGAGSHAAHGPVAFSRELSNWILMVAAMMIPLVLPMLRAASALSFWSRRHRTIALALTGFFVPWFVLGLASAAVRGFPWVHSPLAAPLAFAAAALWIATPFHMRGLVRCHRRLPLAPDGWRADRDCLRYGYAIGAACCASCWPLMLACAFTGHHAIAMVGGFAIGVLERASFRPQRRKAIALTLGLAAFYLFQALTS
jgi:predicted metal-binding membrane protein